MALNQLRYGAGSVVVGEEAGGGGGHPSQYHQPGANDPAPAPIAAVAAAFEKGAEVKREHPGAGEDPEEEEEAARKMQRLE